MASSMYSMSLPSRVNTLRISNLEEKVSSTSDTRDNQSLLLSYTEKGHIGSPD